MSDSRPNVLVLDDDPLSLELYSRELSCDYRVTTSNGVIETRHHLGHIRFDVLIIEPAVDDGEGWSLLNEIFSVDDPPRVVLCSIEDERVTGLKQGACAFLVKPVLPATLHALLDQITMPRRFQSV